MLRRFSSSIPSSLYATAGASAAFKVDPARVALPTKKLVVCPSGKVDLPARVYREALLDLFGVGGWALVPASELQLRGRTFSREWALFAAGGHFVSQARGEFTPVEWLLPASLPSAFDISSSRRSLLDALADGDSAGEVTVAPGGGSMALLGETVDEAVKGAALSLCCRDVGLFPELQDPEWTDEYRKSVSKVVVLENTVTMELVRAFLPHAHRDVAPPWKVVDEEDIQAAVARAQQVARTVRTTVVEPDAPLSAPAAAVPAAQDAQQVDALMSGLDMPFGDAEQPPLFAPSPSYPGYGGGGAPADGDGMMFLDPKKRAGGGGSSAAASSGERAPFDPYSQPPPAFKKLVTYKTWMEVLVSPALRSYLHWCTENASAETKRVAREALDYAKAAGLSGTPKNRAAAAGGDAAASDSDGSGSSSGSDSDSDSKQ